MVAHAGVGRTGRTVLQKSPSLPPLPAICLVSNKLNFFLNLKVSHDTLGVSEVLQGLLRCLGGGITRGLAEGALAASLAGSGELVVASLKETRGVLWRVGGGITQGSAGIALAF